MIDILRPRRKKSRPKKELKSKTVSAARFNAMIDYYTRELRSRLSEIKKLRQENDMLIRTSVKNADRAGQNSEQVKKLSEEVRILKSRLKK